MKRKSKEDTHPPEMKKIRLENLLDPFSKFPVEISLKILLCLKANEILKATRVCRTWHTLANDSNLWKYQYISFWKNQLNHFSLEEQKKENFFKNQSKAQLLQLPKQLQQFFSLFDKKIYGLHSNSDDIPKKQIDSSHSDEEVQNFEPSLYSHEVVRSQQLDLLKILKPLEHFGWA